ncbi:ferredoxin [Rhodococcus sp. MEB064]|uniref:ferredoxin n=1 Tax=Rhodococcus sp. MEB064 TaxID=1587522 RepID=UPI0009E4CD31
MAFRLDLDAGRCQGYANCLIEAPQLWDFDEDTDRAVPLIDTPDESLRTVAEASVRNCPAQAISLTDIAS